MFFRNAYLGRNGFWRWLATTAGTIAVIILAQIPLFIFVESEAARLGMDLEAFFANGVPAGADRNMFLLLFLLPFACGLGVLALFITQLHKKPLRSVFTGRTEFNWPRAFTGFAIWFILLGVATFAVLPSEAYRFQFDAAKFLPLLLIALLLIPLQTTLEELFFRGYLMQGLSLLVRNRIGALVAVTLMFWLMHSSNPEFSSGGGLGALEYFLMSALLGLAAVLDEGLEVPCGIHAANNIFLALIISTSDGTLQTDALFETNTKAYTDNFLFLSVLPYAVGFILLFAIFRWRISTLIRPIGR